MDTLDASIGSREIICHGLSFHILECGNPRDELILLIHGFPELAYSWRKVLPILAKGGYHVVAPDMRGYGQTHATRDSTAAVSYKDGLAGYGMADTIAEVTSLVHHLYRESHDESSVPVVKLVVGHDMGSSIAASLALSRPDIFKSLIMMSAPYTGPPSSSHTYFQNATDKLQTYLSLNFLDPPRKHYQPYFCAEDTNSDLMNAPQGLAAFFRGYYYYKSGLWSENRPRKLGDSWAPPERTAEALALLPHYYIMPIESSMPEVVQRAVSGINMAAKMPWMTEAELNYYVEQFSRTGFQGGLNQYRARLDRLDPTLVALMADRRIEVPAAFISGERDWGNYQEPGAIDKMQSEQVMAKNAFKGCTFVPGAGHWVQQEQPEKTAEAILAFLSSHVA